MRRRCVFLGGMSARGFRVVLAAASFATLSSRAVADDGEQAVLAFACAVDRGRVVLTPSPERSYRVLGTRASHAFTTCAPLNPEKCRTWQIHKFDLNCGGQRVSWLSVAGAVIERTPARGHVDNGRLSLRLGPAWQKHASHPVPVGFRAPFDRPEHALTFPAGYAPGLGTGLRFTGAPASLPTVVEARSEPKMAKSEAKIALSARPAGPTEAGDALTTSGGQSPTLTEAWITTVMPSGGVATAFAELNPLRAMIGLLALGVAWAGLVFVRRSSAQAQVPPSSDAALPIDDDAALCSEMIARSVNLHRAARDAVGAVPSENLREILTTDLAKVQRHLLSADLTEDVAEERWHAVKPKVTVALADLERIGRIIAGVLSSQPIPEPLFAATSAPETADQAFEILGVNPDASRTVVKKVVDGLRQSWHPDHARDELDRRRRDERMKQINASWDLIRSRYGDLETERAA